MNLWLAGALKLVMNRPTRLHAASDEAYPLTDEFATDLRDLSQTEVGVSVDVDIRVMNRARAHFLGFAGQQRVIRPTRGRRFSWFAAAAVWALLAIVAARFGTSGASDPRLVGDVDRTGYVDIVDAMLLARRVAEMESTWSAWDVSGDGVVDDADVAVIARRAVSLGWHTQEVEG